MEKFKNYEEAKEFAEIRLEDLEFDERLLIMKKDNEYVVTSNYTDYTSAKEAGYEYVLGIYKEDK